MMETIESQLSFLPAPLLAVTLIMLKIVVILLPIMGGVGA